MGLAGCGPGHTIEAGSGMRDMRNIEGGIPDENILAGDLGMRSFQLRGAEFTQQLNF